MLSEFVGKIQHLERACKKQREMIRNLADELALEKMRNETASRRCSLCMRDISCRNREVEWMNDVDGLGDDDVMDSH